MSERSLRKRSSALAIGEECHSKKLRQSNLFEQNKCLFCEKDLKYLKGNTKESLTKCQTDNASTSIINAVKAQEDWTLHAKIGGRCLISAEAWYHNTCRRNYLCKKERTINEEEKVLITSFDVICKHIDEHVLQTDGVETLEHVHELYQAHMKENNLSDYNPKYKQLFLKNKLSVRYKDDLCCNLLLIAFHLSIIKLYFRKI
ncbi:unnamed protein product [Owenia fusiformis]|uniref:Uncharacterized protein n=1 Tax=Owenia fusiformis TaxID=6347 RepID=A0A8J1Y0I7_OWEFU|nr:unnamed protein product [Owenia fusiformis]